MCPMRPVSRKLIVWSAVLYSGIAGCNPITNSLSNGVRQFSSKNDINTTDAQSLLKEGPGRNAHFSPAHQLVRFKDVPDSALSSSYGRGLLHHEHPGYAAHDEHEGSPHAYGYEYRVPALAPGPFHGPYGTHHEIDYHHKHYDHALAVKTFLWPIAGIALLGAAAALISNPVLLQLGVVSGRRRRRDTEETSPQQVYEELSWLKNKNKELFPENSKATMGLIKRNGKIYSNQTGHAYTDKSHSELKQKGPIKKYSLRREALFQKLRSHPTVQSPVDVAVDYPTRNSIVKHIDDNKLFPVPLIIKEKM